MLDRKEIDIEIARLEYGESSYPAYAKLANLYTIRDRMDRQERQMPYEVSYSAAPAAPENSSVVGTMETVISCGPPPVLTSTTPGRSWMT